jgi:hypothetical protein
MVLWTAAILCFALLVTLAISTVMLPDWLDADDYVEYWSAGKLNLTGGNPFDPAQLLILQRSTGKAGEEAVMMWNPPWTLALVMPFGLLPYPLSRTAWLLFNLLIVFGCASTLWRLYEGPSEKVWIAWCVAFTFIPVIDALRKGQTGILLLLGVTGFLYFVQRRRLGLAGISLALLAIKPHVLYIFAMAAVIWAIDRRAWRVIFGLVGSLLAGTALAWLANPEVFQQYFYAAANYPPRDWATPTLGGVLRLLFGPEKFWLQFLPPALGSAWFLGFEWRRHRGDWDWTARAPKIILVSLLTTAYGWSFDQPAALVAILPTSLLVLQRPRERASLLITGAYASIVVLMLLLRGNDFSLFWLAPAILAWYLFSSRLNQRRVVFPSP